VSYLGSPVALRQPPNNRIERAIANADLTLGHLSDVSREFSDAAKGKQSGVLLRLALNPDERRSTDQTLASLAAILDQVDRSGRGERPGVVGRLALDEGQQRALALLLARANGSLRDVSAITGRLAARDSTLLAHLAGPRADSILGHVTGLTGRLAGPRTDSILAHVDSLTSELSNRDRSLLRRVASPQIDSVTRTVKKPATIGFGALLGLIGVSIVRQVAAIVH